MGKSRWRSEAEFQAFNYRWYMTYVPEQEWGRLIGIYNNPPNITQLLSMGLRPGISDFLYYPPDEIYTRYFKDGSSIQDTRLHCPVWIELKILGKKQNPSQLKFEPMVKAWGHEYHLVTEDPVDFQNVIHFYRNKNNKL